MVDTDISSPEGVSYMIGYSVRWAIPFIYLVVAASSVRYLFSGAFPIWWMRNRKYIGLVFAVAMAWQALFIFILSTVYRDYYFDQVFYFRDELEGSVGYIFLVGMVVTSFQFARKKVNQAQWKLIQKGGVYFLGPMHLVSIGGICSITPILRDSITQKPMTIYLLGWIYCFCRANNSLGQDASIRPLTLIYQNSILHVLRNCWVD